MEFDEQINVTSISSFLLVSASHILMSKCVRNVLAYAYFAPGKVRSDYTATAQ